MKAKVKPRINLDNRVPLQTVIPLSTPFVLFVDPVNTCNFQCKFCPTGDRDLIKKTGRWQGRINFDLYRTIIDGLEEFEQPLKVLRLYKEGEPLLHTRFADMVSYAKKSGYVEYVDTTTNGYLLTPEKVGPLLDAGIDRINISVDGMSDEQYWDFAHVRVDFDRFVNNIRYLYQHKGDCEICVKIPGDILSSEDKARFFETFGEISDRVFIENIAPCWPAFNVEEYMDIQIREGIYGQPIGEVQSCPYIFYSIAVNTDGTVSLCFLDWERTLIIGDTKTQTIKEIWESQTLREHQVAHLQGRRKHNATCAECGQLSHCLPDNIDAYTGQIMERMAGRPGSHERRVARLERV